MSWTMAPSDDSLLSMRYTNVFIYILTAIRVSTTERTTKNDFVRKRRVACLRRGGWNTATPQNRSNNKHVSVDYS